jgi:hypothetical protein
MKTGIELNIQQALLWLWNTTKHEAAPFEASGEIGADNIILSHTWKCRGCYGEFYFRWKGPYTDWEAPTDETFPHEPGCRYVETKKLIKELSRHEMLPPDDPVCNCGGDERTI